jgi:purine nucleoside phosphorylase
LKYDYDAADIAYEESVKLGIQTFQGTYCWYPGPAYETPLEIKAYVDLGANLFGMSTVPEILAAQAHDMRMVVMAVITNLAAGLSKKAPDGFEVVQSAKAAAEYVENVFM